MKLKIIKNDNEMMGKLIYSDGKEVEFSNLKMIDFLYKSSEKVEFEFHGTTNEEETKIRNLFNKIYQKAVEEKRFYGIGCGPGPHRPHQSP